MNRVLASLVICGLSISGDCFGLEIKTLRQGDPCRNSNLVEIAQLPDNVEHLPEVELQRDRVGTVDIARVKVVNAGIGFRIAAKFMNSDQLLRKYGTEDGIVYYLGNGENIFLQCKDGPSGRTPVQFIRYDGNPIPGLRQALENTYSVSSEVDEVANEVDVSRIEVKKAGMFFRLVYRCTGLSDLLSSMFGTRDGTVYRLENDENVFLWRNEISDRTRLMFMEYSGDPVEGLIQRLQGWAM